MKRLSTFLLLLLSLSYSIDTMCGGSRKKRHAQQVAARQKVRQEEAQREAELDRKYSQKLEQQERECCAQEVKSFVDEVIALQEDVHEVDGPIEGGLNGRVSPLREVVQRSYLQAAKVSTERRRSMDATVAADVQRERRSSVDDAERSFYDEEALRLFNEELAVAREMARVDAGSERALLDVLVGNDRLVFIDSKDDSTLTPRVPVNQQRRGSSGDAHGAAGSFGALQQWHHDNQAKVERAVLYQEKVAAELAQADRIQDDLLAGVPINQIFSNHGLNKRNRNIGIGVVTTFLVAAGAYVWNRLPIVRDVEVEDKENTSLGDEFVLRSPVTDDLDDGDFAMLIKVMEESGEL